MVSQTVLSSIDWLLIGAVLLFSLLVGVFLKDKAGEGGVEEFFTANRNMKWWFLGTSMVATTFGADTPLVITGWIAKYGIAGNWFWWSNVVAMVAISVFFARKWRCSGVVTDVELTELRYGGKPAATLRTAKAFVSAMIVNPIVIGWLFAAMAKISEPFMDWHYLLGSTLYEVIESAYPTFLLFGTLDNSITIWVLLGVTLAYSSLGGMRAILVTDLFQFVLAMGMSILLTWLAISHIGGLEVMWDKLAEIYPNDVDNVSPGAQPFLPHDRLSAFVPSFGDGVVGTLGIPFSAFVLTLGVKWWTESIVDGSGYIAQRLYTAKDGGEAEKGALWFAYANFILRSWPWAIAGIAALVIYPRADVHTTAESFTNCLNDRTLCSVEMVECLENRFQCQIKEYGLLYKEPTTDIQGSLTEDTDVGTHSWSTTPNVVFVEDRERSYPALIKDVLPAGLKGLAVAALIAAFMSTLSTHINWGASYITNDFYMRFVQPNAGKHQLSFVSRLASIGIALLSAFIATFIDKLGDVWELYAGMVAGLGLPHLMRWLWWRANAWTEISAMTTGLFLATANYIVGQVSGYPEGQISIFPGFMSTHPIHTICWIAMISYVVALGVTFLTDPVDVDTLRKFAQKIRPIGLWNGHNHGYDAERGLGESVAYWLLGTSSIYAGMFGIGYLLKLEYIIGISLVFFSVMALVIMIRGMSRVDEKRRDLISLPNYQK